MIKCIDCPLCEKDHWEYDCNWECKWDEHGLGGYSYPYRDHKIVVWDEEKQDTVMKIAYDEANEKRKKQEFDCKNQECSLSIEELEKVLEFFNDILKEKQGVGKSS